MENNAGIQYEGEERFPDFVNMVSHDAKLKQLLRNLTSIESKLCSEASKEFRKLLKSDFGFELLTNYIQTSPKLVELLQVWELRKGNPGFSHFLKLITGFFSHPSAKSKCSSNGNVMKEFPFVCSALDKFARVIVEGKMGDLYKELSSKEAKRQNAVLLLLASIVRRGQGLAWEVAKSFDFKLEAFSKHAVWKPRRNEGKRKNLTRRAFVGFAMSFLEVGNPRLLRGILQQRNMYSGVLRGLGNDDDETVGYVLSTLCDRVLIPDSLVPPGLRSVLFGSVTLEQLISISGRWGDDVAVNLAHNLLIAVCTNPSNGLMPDLGRVSNPLKGNRKRLLDLMKKLKAIEVDYHRDLLLAIVKGRPALGSAYLDEFPYNLEDLASPNWFAAVSLAANVMSSVGDALAFGFSDSRFQDPPSYNSSDVQDIVKCIAPRPFTRLVINKGLLHSDPLVKHGTLRLVLEELKLLDSLICTLNDICTSKGQVMHKWASLKQDIQNGVRILLPDPQVLLSLVSSFNKSYKNPKSNLKRLADRETREHNFKVKKLKASAMNDDTDILVGGVSSSPLSALGGEGEGVIGKSEVNKLISNADLVNPVPEIWGLHRCSSRDIAVEDAETYFYSKLLDVLQIYHRTLPMSFEGSFDFFRVLPSNPLALPTILQRSILSLLVEQVTGSHKDEIAMKCQPHMYKYLQPFINIFMYSPISDIKNQAYTLAQAAMFSTGAFDQNPSEICTWFLFIPGGSKDNIYAQNMEIEIFQKLSSAVISFLCDAVSTTGNNLFKYLDTMRCYISDAQGAKDISTNFSPFIICVLEKCLRLLGSESGTSSLPEKSLISLYVSTTLKYLLETQVEPGLLSSLVGFLLSEKLEGCCNMIGVSSLPCEWRPLKSLLHFSRNIMHHEICGSFTAAEEAIGSGGSLSSTLTEVERIVGSEYHDALLGITIGFSFSMVCTPPKELVHNFPGVISMSSQLLGVPFSLLCIIFFLEPSHLSHIFKLWPEVCSAGMKKVKARRHHGEGKEEIVCYEVIDSLESASVAFSLFLERAPFHVLFPAILFIDDSCSLGEPEMQNLLLDKLSKGTPEYSIYSFCHVLSCIYHARLSYRIKPSRELEQLCDFSFLLAGQILRQCLVEKVGYDWVPFSTRVKQVVEIIFCHPLVTETLESPLSSEESFTDETFMKSPESFLEFAGQVLNKMDHQVIDLLRTTSELLAPLYCNCSYLSGVHCANEQIAEVFKALADKLILILKYKFIDGIKSKDLTSLIPTLFTVHRLVDFISPFELLELVHWLFSRIDLNDTTISPSFKGCTLAVGLYTAGCVFDSFSVYMVQLNLKGAQFHLFTGREKRSIDVSIFEKILFQVIEIATSFELDLADLCLLKAVKVIRSHKNMETASLPFIMSMSRLVSSIPIKILSHCMHMVTKTKAELLFLFCEISPLHLSIFGQLFSDMMDNCNHPHSDLVLMLLPTVLLYLNAAFLKFGGQLYQHFANIISFFWRMLSHGFSNWKSYVLEDMFDIRSLECWPLSMEQFLNLVSHSLLGKAILLMQHYLHLSGHLVKLKDRLFLFNSVCPHSSKYDDLLDFNIREVSVSLFEQPLNLANVTVAKIRFCRMLLFPDHNQFQSLLEEDGTDNKIHSEVSSSRVRFLNMLVKSWQLIVKKYNSDIGSSGQGEKANFLLFRFLETFIADNILEVVVEMRDYLVKLNSLPFIEQLAKTTLLYRFDDPSTLKILRTVLTSLSEGKFSCILILQLLLSHSQFASTLLAGCGTSGSTQFGMAYTPISSIMKSVVYPRIGKNDVRGESNTCMSELHMKQLELVKLLRVLFQIKAQKCNSDAEACSAINLKELILLLLSSYSAMVTETDLEIYFLINELESSDESVPETIIEMDYLWGPAALRVRKEREGEQSVSMNSQYDAEAVKEHRRIQFRENFPIDPKLCEKTLLFFPHDRFAGKKNLNKPKTDDFREFLLSDAANDEKMQVYNPLFILNFASHCLSMGYVEPLEFASFGLLALAFLSLSSPDEDMRKLGYEVLGIFKSSLEKCEKRKDVTRLRLLLTYMQNGITEPLQRISSVTAVFVAEASFVLLDSSHDHYSAISKTILRSPSANMKAIPLFQEFFWSSSVTFKTERLWILRLLNTALNADDDAQIYIRNSIFENLMSFYTSPLADSEAKELIIQMVKKSIKLHKLARYLVEQCGIILWFSSLVSSFSGSLCKDGGGSQLAQLAELLEVVNEIVAFRNTSEWLQKYALEQLAELSSRLCRLLLVCVEFTQKEARVTDLILQIVMSTLKISQKRKVYQPHVTLSFEGLFQLCEAVNARSVGRFSPTAELGLKVILMSTPAITIWDMDQGKLLKFLSWAISAAAQSNIISMPQSEAACHRSVIFSEESSGENLTAKLLRWLTASVILGRLSWKSSDVDYSFHSDRLKLHTLESMVNYSEKGSGENQGSLGHVEILAASIFYLQQLVGIHYKLLPSVVSALCLLLFTAPSVAEPNGDGFTLTTLLLKIRSPPEANPAWRWSYYQPWKDLSSECADVDKLEEIQACQMLLIAVSKKLGGKSLFSESLSLQDLENCRVFQWERSILESPRCSYANQNA